MRLLLESMLMLLNIFLWGIEFVIGVWTFNQKKKSLLYSYGAAAASSLARLVKAKSEP